MEYVATCFPLIVGLVVVALSPRRIDPSETPFPELPSGTRPHPNPTRLAWAYIGLSFGVAPVLAVAQWLLFRAADSVGEQPLCVLRGTDMVAYPLIPGLFMGFSVGALLLYHATRWCYGRKFREFLFTTDKDGPMYRQFNIVPHVALAIGAVLCALNFMARDTFVRLDPGKLSFNRVWSLETNVRTAEQIEGIRCFPRGGQGGPLVVFRFSDGAEYSTRGNVDAWHAEEFEAAVVRAFGDAVPIERD